VPDGSLTPVVELSREEAGLILGQWLNRRVECSSLRRLLGGCCSTVLEAAFDGAESPVVIKLLPEASESGLADDARVLSYYRRHTDFRVPEPFWHDASGELLPYLYLVMERIPGQHLGDAGPELSPAERRRVEHQMARAVAELHTHTGPTYGNIRAPETWDDWTECMHARILDLHDETDVGRLLSEEAMGRVRSVLDALPELLAAPCPPTLVHGDLWATNILVDHGKLSGFVDPTGWFAHREYELAYLQIWRTVSDAFFEPYHEIHPRIEGYERRRPVYWLHTLLLHVWLFQTPNYIRSTEQLLADLRL